MKIDAINIKIITTLTYQLKPILISMELYHKTLLPSTNHHLAHALHLLPIKPKEEHDKPRQILLATTYSLELYKYHSQNSHHLKY